MVIYTRKHHTGPLMKSLQRNIHWPSLFLFLMAIIAAFSNAGDKVGALMQVAGFVCMGYASLRLVPSDLLTQKASLIELVKTSPERRTVDDVFFVVGLGLITSSLLLKFVV